MINYLYKKEKSMKRDKFEVGLKKYIVEAIKNMNGEAAVSNSLKRQRLIERISRQYIMERDGVPVGGDDIVDKVVPVKPKAKDDKAVKSERIMVKIFFEKLEKSGLMKYLSFTNVLDQADAIIKFANIVGVPSNKISDIIDNFRRIAAKRDNANAEDSENSNDAADVKNPKKSKETPQPDTNRPDVKVTKSDDSEEEIERKK